MRYARRSNRTAPITSEIKIYAQAVNNNRSSSGSSGCLKLRQANLFLNKLSKTGLYRKGAGFPIRVMTVFSLTNTISNANTPLIGAIALTYVSTTPTWTASGVVWNGTSAYGNLNWNPSTQLTGFDAHFAAWKTSKGANNGANGSQENDLGNAFLMGIEGATSYYSMNTSTESLTGATSLDVVGFQILTRLNGTTSYRLNGVQQVTRSVTETLPPNLNLYLGNVNTAPSATNYYNTDRYMAVSVGEGMSDNQADDLYRFMSSLKSGIFA